MSEHSAEKDADARGALLIDFTIPGDASMDDFHARLDEVLGGLRPLFRGWPSQVSLHLHGDAETVIAAAAGELFDCTRHGHKFSAFGGDVDNYCMNCGEARVFPSAEGTPDDAP